MGARPFHHQGRMDVEYKFVVVSTFQKALTRQISEVVRTTQRVEDLILNKKGVFNQWAIPELAVKFKCKMWEEERRKFEPTPDLATVSLK